MSGRSSQSHSCHRHPSKLQTPAEQEEAVQLKLSSIFVKETLCGFFLASITKVRLKEQAKNTGCQ